MMLEQWRKKRELTMAEAATLLSISHAGSYRRYETGENRPDAPLMAEILSVTEGAVTLQDMHDLRLQWIRENRPEILERLHLVDVQEVAE